MAKRRVAAVVKIQIPAGKATPAPPSPFDRPGSWFVVHTYAGYENKVKQNLEQRIRSQHAEDQIFEDRSFTFITKTPPTPFLLRQAAGIEKGSQNPRLEKAATVTKAQLRQIAETKQPDLNAIDLDGAMRQIAGTARSMGIDVVD